MTILEYYLEKSKDSSWKNKFQSTSEKQSGKIFLYMNTNYRSLSSFDKQFRNFIDYNDLERSKWKKHDRHGQEQAKHYVINMQRSKLFKKYGSLFRLTKKGESFKQMLEFDFNKEEKWILIYCYLLNSYFGLKPKYIINRVEEMMLVFKDSQINIEKLMLDIRNLLIKKIKLKENLFVEDIFWILTFNEDPDFLNIFSDATEHEKEELKNYAVNAYKNSNEDDLIAYKFKNSGQYTLNSFIDDIKVVYFTQYANDIKVKYAEGFYSALVEEYCNLNKLNPKRIIEFINQEKDVFDVVYKELFGKFEEDIVDLYTKENLFNQSVMREDFSTYITEERIDETSAQEASKIVYVSSLLKKIAKERSKYSCELEKLEDCRYFTSKENGKNYLEIHHLVPREFANEFENSIEIIDNYVALCPHCHRMLHFANDRERYSSIKYLFSLRRERLIEKRIQITIEDLKEYYGIDEK